MKKTALILKSIEKFSTRIGHGKIVEPDHQAWTSNVPQWCQAVLLSLLDQSSHNHSFALKTQYVGKDYARGPEYCCCCQQWRIPIEKRKKEKWIRTWRKARYQIPTWEVVVCNTELPELDETAGNETSVSWSCNLATFSFNSCRWWATSFFKCEDKSWREGLWAMLNHHQETASQWLKITQKVSYFTMFVQLRSWQYLNFRAFVLVLICQSLPIQQLSCTKTRPC